MYTACASAASDGGLQHSDVNKGLDMHTVTVRTGSVFQDGDRSNWNIFQGGWDLSSVFGTVALCVQGPAGFKENFFKCRALARCECLQASIPPGRPDGPSCGRHHRQRPLHPGGAHALPQTKASLDKVAKSLREVRAARESGGPLPAQRHRCVEECLKSDDPVMVGLMLLALQVDLDTRLQRLATLHEAAKNSATAAAAGGPDPVLSALGEDGRNRLMWEYYKAYVHKRPKYGKPVAMAYKPGSYLQQLHAILVHHFAKPGSRPENARPLPHMKSPKALRDALCRWCVFWTQTRPPFFRDGPRADWTAEQWEALPMHSLPGEDIQRYPVYENDACRVEEAEEDGDTEDEQAADGDEGTGEDTRPVNEVALQRLSHQRKAARHEVPEMETEQESGDEVEP